MFLRPIQEFSLMRILISSDNRERWRFLLSSLIFSSLSASLANNYLFKVNNRNTRERCEIFSKLTSKTPLVSKLRIIDHWITGRNSYIKSSETRAITTKLIMQWIYYRIFVKFIISVSFVWNTADFKPVKILFKLCFWPIQIKHKNSIFFERGIFQWKYM